MPKGIELEKLKKLLAKYKEKVKQVLNKNIFIELKGLKRGSGYIKISIEGVPYFENAVDKAKRIQQSKDEEAF